MHDDLKSSFHQSDDNESIIKEQAKTIAELAAEVKKCRDAEHLLREMIEKNPISIQILDKNGVSVAVNKAHTLFFGARPKTNYSVFDDQLLLEQGLGKMFEKLRKGEVVFFPDTWYNAHLLNPDFANKTVWIKTLGFPIPDSQGRPDSYVIMHEDITQRKKSEEKLKRLNKQLSKATMHLKHVKEYERKEISREIHDELSQILSCVKIDIGLLGEKLKEPDLKSEAKAVYNKIDNAIEAVQNIIANLKPDPSSSDDIVKAMELYIGEMMQKSRIEIKTRIEKKIILTPGVSIHVYKILKESLTNIFRHAEATKVIIKLKMVKGSLVFSIADNGCGITAKQIRSPKSHGIESMRERTELMGGSFSIKKAKKGGTQIIINIPLQNIEPDEYIDL